MTTKPSAANVAKARYLLASEGDGSSTEASAAASGRVYEKLEVQLGPLIGPAGVRALFMRSAKLASQSEGSPTGVATSLESATTLRAWLQSLAPSAALETAAVLLGTFLELITTFVGERLTVQVLRQAWPEIEDMAPWGIHK